MMYKKKDVEMLFKEMHPDFKSYDKHKARLCWDVLVDSLCKDHHIRLHSYQYMG
jgi:hypothetical protein